MLTGPPALRCYIRLGVARSSQKGYVLALLVTNLMGSCGSFPVVCCLGFSSLRCMPSKRIIVPSKLVRGVLGCDAPVSSPGHKPSPRPGQLPDMAFRGADMVDQAISSFSSFFFLQYWGLNPGLANSRQALLSQRKPFPALGHLRWR